MRYYILAIVLLLCFSTTVTAAGTSGEPYTYYNFPKCVGQYQALVTSYINTTYTLPNCTQTEEQIWTCPCKDSATILVRNDSEGHFDITLQYYIGQKKEESNTSDTNPTANDLYNENIKRIQYLKNILIVMPGDTGLKEGQQEIPVGDFIFFIFMLLIVLVLIGVGIIVFIYIMSDRIKRWLGLGKDEDLTLKAVLVKIFSRSNVRRKSIGKRDRDFQAKQQGNNYQAPVAKKETTVTEDPEDEIRRIMDEMSK